MPWAMEPSPSTLINKPNTNGELSEPRYLLLKSIIFWITMAPGAASSKASSIWANSEISEENSLANIAACSSGSAWDESSADASRTARRVLPSSSMEIPRSDPLTPFLVPARIRYSNAAICHSICSFFSCSMASRAWRIMLLS